MRRRWVRMAVSVAPLVALLIMQPPFLFAWCLSMFIVLNHLSWRIYDRMVVADSNRMTEWWADNEGYENPEHDQAREPDL